MDSTQYATLATGAKSRKLVKNPKNCKRLQDKEKRYSRKKLPILPKCNHQGSFFKCKNIKGRDAMWASDGFYNSKKKLEQDAFLLSCCASSAPKRKNRAHKGGSRKNISTEYFITKKNGTRVRICQKAFLNLFNVSKFRLQRICKKFHETCELPTEKRGGNTTGHKYLLKKNAVIEFIKKFKVLEIHYCRSKTSGRQYLPSELSIAKMAQIYNEAADSNLKVRESYFRTIFNTKFNIGFKMPSQDMCSTCIMYKERIKIETNVQIKNKFIALLRVHKLRAAEFYKKLKEEQNDLLIISFDCQKNMVLPKIADQSAYYSRQLYLYNFGIVVGTSNSSLSRDNVLLYIWTEVERGKGSNEIVSAVFNCLNQLNLCNINKIRLVADGCGGQNKNSIMIGMISFWLSAHAPSHLKEVEIVFPVTGHSFLPPDRVFATSENIIRTKQSIIAVEEYLEIYDKLGTVIRLGSEECPVFDFKAEVGNILKPPAQWHFKFNMTKRFYIKRTIQRNIVVRGECSYRCDFVEFKSIQRKGKKINNLKLSKLNIGNSVKKAKLTDVDKLLQKHFGQDWQTLNVPSLKFYKDALSFHQNEIYEEEEILSLCGHNAEDEYEPEDIV